VNLFFKSFITSLLLDAPATPALSAVFSRVGAGPDRMIVRDGLSVFLHQYVTVDGLAAALAARGCGADLDRAALSERLRAAKRALEAVVATSTDVDELMGAR
jgi:hypothetical protein